MNSSRNAQAHRTAAEIEEDERRRGRRLPVEVQIQYEHTEDFLTDYTANMSLGGMFIKTDHPLELETRFRLRFRLPDSERSIDTVAVVRWRVPPESAGPLTPGMGVRFETLAPADAKAVETLLMAWE